MSAKIAVRLSFILWMLGGCTLFQSEEEHAGGEDFPNTIQAALEPNMGKVSGWDLTDSLAEPLPKVELTGAHLVSPGGAKGPLAKRSPAEGDIPDLREDSVIIDTVGDTVLYYIWKSNNTIEQRDTMVVRFDTKYQDADSANDNIVRLYGSRYHKLWQNLISSHTIEDGDGDGLLTIKPGRTNRAVFYEKADSVFIFKEERFVLEPGIDLDYDTWTDNIIVSAASAHTFKNGDTIRYDIIVDADGDSILNPSADNEENLARHIKVEYGLFKIITTTEILLEAGPDLDFGEDGNPASSDNRIHILTITVSQSGNLREVSEWLDADGNSIVSPIASRKKNRARFRKTTYPVIAQYHKQVDEVVVDAGPDQKFNREADNRIVSLESGKYSDTGDTLAYLEAVDPANKGYSPLGSDSCTVNLRLAQWKPFAPLFVEKREISMKLLILDSITVFPLKYDDSQSLRNGGTLTVSITGRGNNSKIDPADTVDGQLEFYPGQQDTVSFGRINIKAGLGDDPFGSHDDELYYIGIYVEDNANGAKSIDFSFTADPPVTMGQEPATGDIALEIINDEKQLTVNAEISPAGATADYQHSNGDAGEITWDAGWKLIQWKKL